MSSFGSLPQGSVSVGYQSGFMTSPQPSGSAPGSGGRRLLVVGIVFVSLLLVVGVVVLLFVLGVFRSHSGSSLANGLQMDMEKLVVIQVEGESAEGVRPYSVFLPEDKLAVFAPVGEKVYFNVVRKATGGEVSSCGSKVSWPGGSDGKGGSLPACGPGQRYSLENNVMACADVAVPKAAGKDEGFGQVLYSGKDLKIVAAPGVDNAKALSGFSPDGKLLWSKELATPGQVSFDGSRVIVTSFEGSKVSIEGYGAVEESQKSSEAPTLVEAAKGPDKDAIKDFDFMNNFVPAETGADDFYCDYSSNDGTPLFHKIPDTNDGCWFAMIEGESQEIIEGEGLFEGWHILSFDFSDPNLQPKYADINSDGYTDLLVVGRLPEDLEQFAYIFDPTDPEHPYVATLGFIGQDSSSGYQYGVHGLIEARGRDTKSGEPCVMSRYRVENDANGVPRVVDYERGNFLECL